MTEITDVDTGPAAEIDNTTCSRCSAERLEGVPFCTNCNLRFEVAAPATYQPARRRPGLPSRKLLLVLPLLLAAAALLLLLG
jgi:hypothetical protein